MVTPRVGLFVTCLVDAMRPNIGFASIKLLEDAGCIVEVPEAQTCCGQPAFNSGDDATTAKIAEGIIETFEPFDYVVVPSGSCGGMIRRHFDDLFPVGSEWQKRQRGLSAKTYEILSFLQDVLGHQPSGAQYDGTATYHDSCSGLRDLGVFDQPRKMLADVSGLKLVPLIGNDACCGFGGTFCVKYPDISNAIVTDKADAIEATGADTLLAGDLGCLMNMSGKLTRKGSKIKAFHTVEVLAGMADGPGIVEGDG